MDPNEFKEPGLYLLFPDSTRMVVTKEDIDTFASTFLNDPTKVPPNVKKAVDYQACEICPMKNTAVFCHALMPTLPFIDIADKYVSYDEVTAVYKSPHDDLLYVSTTTMQRALQYVSILSLMYYCEVGKKYWDYYYGIIPLMDLDDVIVRIYLNIYRQHKGNKKEIDKIIEAFKSEITVTSKCQVKRLHLICKHDSLANAFVLTQVSSELLSQNMEKTVEKSFAKFRSQGF